MAIPAGAVGYRYCPSDEDILSCLRERTKADLLSLPAGAFIECDIYGDEDKEPWNLFDKSSYQCFYVFTTLNKKNKSRARISRVAGIGTWDSRSKRDSINGLGFRRYFVFKTKNPQQPRSGDNGNWVMHEYSLQDDDSWVLCKIRNKDAAIRDDMDPALVAIDDALLATAIEILQGEAASCADTSPASKKRRLMMIQEPTSITTLTPTLPVPQLLLEPQSSTADNMDVISQSEQDSIVYGDSYCASSSLNSEGELLSFSFGSEDEEFLYYLLHDTNINPQTLL
ncbi:NAM domain-containing protein [Cephalotus follicularis]|uniref:NAM domain-containing protein n=1 Tax=Cephalotus follicularis TaxID=3775 RepID=A0A1Q3C3D8_CEPFO|nr:NAM domain-containing protein [Cephalotus follicularis]